MKQITVKVESDLFTQMDEKRHREKTSFQEVGAQLFEGWVEGRKFGEDLVEVEGLGTLSQSERDYVIALLQILREKPDFTYHGITGVLDAWLVKHPAVKPQHDERRTSKGKADKRAG